MSKNTPLPLYLTLMEVWRNRGRFLIFSLVIALITMLVLFVAALGEGLANANRQFLDKVDADLLAVQENMDLSLTTSRIGSEKLSDLRRINGIADAGPLAFSNGTLVFGAEDTVDVSLIGVEPGALGNPKLLAGEPVRNKYADEIVIDENLAETYGLTVGDMLVLRTVQGADEEFFNLRIVGITEEQAYFFAPSVFLPLYTWEEVRPQGTGSPGIPVANVVALKLDEGISPEEAIARIDRLVNGVEVSDKESIIQAQPGYSAQQSTVNAQQGFALLIGTLVLGGFFQIQTLQKVPQIGMLKAIGATNRTVAAATFTQVVVVTLLGVGLGSLLTFGMALGIPENVPIQFTANAIILAMSSLLAIGPLGGVFSIRMATKVEPLLAMGL